MAKIEIERGTTIQRGRPKSAHIKLIGDDGNVKGYIGIYPIFEKPPFSDNFRVEVHKGDVISPEVDIRLIL